MPKCWSLLRPVNWLSLNRGAHSRQLRQSLRMRLFLCPPALNHYYHLASSSLKELCLVLNRQHKPSRHSLHQLHLLYPEPHGALQIPPERLQKPLAAFAGLAPLKPPVPHVLRGDGNRDAPQPFALARKRRHHRPSPASAASGEVPAATETCQNWQPRNPAAVAAASVGTIARATVGVNASVVDTCRSLTSSAV